MKMPKLDWTQVATLAILVGGAVAFTVFAPAEYHAPAIALFTAAAGWLRSPHAKADDHADP